MVSQNMLDDCLNKYGVDIAVRRADDLDRKAILWVQQKVQEGTVPSVLDLGCGAGGQSVRMVNAVACVIGVDVGEFEVSFEILRTKHSLTVQQLQFIQQDVRDGLLPIINDRKIDMCVMQRVLHYLSYNDALLMLKELKQSGAWKLFVSVTGIESDIGRVYEDVGKKVQDRFCSLSLEDQKKFYINQPVCLYTPEEFVVLLQEAGWEIEECWVSAFGNIKAVCI